MGEHEGAPSSQIDFVFVRAQHATSRSKQASALVDYPVASWRGGPRHYPIQAEIPVPRPKWNTSAQAPVTTHVDREQMIQDLRSTTTTMAMHNYRQDVQARLPAPLDDPQANSQSEELANCARTMWGLFRKMRAHRYGMPGIINAWRQWTEFSRAHRVHKARSKQRSKQRKQDLLQQAQTAAAQGNMHEMWKLIRQLAPKAPKKRLQLHREGHMLSPEAELEWILTAYGERYATDPDKAPITFEFPAHSGVFLDSQELKWHLEHLNPRKAVPKGTAPAIAWRACSDLVADPVVQVFNKWRGTEELVLRRWADADVALLPKAHGRSNGPLDWRPIGVQDPLGKCLMSTIVKQAKQAIHDLIIKYPQCAYVKHRSTSTALRQVYAHCHDIREHCSKARLNIHQLYEGETQVKCHGGLQISLDLSAAFDLVEWSHLKQALDLAQVDIAIQEIMLTWLTQVRYLFRHRHLQGSIKPRRGLRQGCTASPILWAVFTSLLCVSIEARTTPEWTRQHLCLHADDSHLRFRFDSYEAFEAVMGEVRIVFACFRLFHLKINMEKTKAILKMVGTLKDRVKKEYVRKHPTTKRLLLSPREPEQWLSLVPHTEYLGLVISYDQFELQSLRHRLTKAHNRRWALASVLHSRRLSIKYKLDIWRSCVYSSMTYGLAHCGLTGDQTEELQRAIMKHTRAVISNQAFLTGDTHESILSRYKIPRIAEDFHKELQRAEQTQAHSPDWMFCPEWHQHLDTRLLQRHTMPDSDDECAQPQVWACPCCERMSGNDEMEEFWGSLQTPSSLLQSNKRRRPPTNGFRQDNPYQPQQFQAQPDLLVTLARQVVRQDEEIKLLKQDHSLILFLRPGEHSILGHLFKTAKEFKAKQAANPQWTPGFIPLKTIMAIALFKELGNRLDTVCQDSTKLATVKEMGWRDPAAGWKFQRWNPQLKALEEDTAKTPLSDKAVAEHLQKLCVVLGQDTVHRFNCTRKMADVMETSATFQLDLSTRTPASIEAWNSLLILQGCTVLQLGGVAYKRETLKPSPVIAKFKDTLRGR
ncbi:unnamed protein product [Symbiodinium sp. CCMP2456]|nr:unnamed protein product [Symbiodinium sp. CCMP2456]